MYSAHVHNYSLIKAAVYTYTLRKCLGKCFVSAIQGSMKFDIQYVLQHRATQSYCSISYASRFNKTFPLSHDQDTFMSLVNQHTCRKMEICTILCVHCSWAELSKWTSLSPSLLRQCGLVQI